MNSITIDHVLQTLDNRVQYAMNVENENHLENNNSQEELTSQLRRQRRLQRRQNERDLGTCNNNKNVQIDLKDLQMIF